MEYVVHLAILVCLYSVLGVSYNLMIGCTGLFTIAHGAFYGIGAYVAALLALKMGFNFFLALLAAIVVAVIISIVIAIPSLRIKGDYLVLMSFGFQIVIIGVLMNWVELTRGPLGLPGIPRPSVFGVSFASQFSYLILTTVICAIVVATAWQFTRSPIGRVLKAIREDEEAAAALGKDVKRFKILVFAVAGGMAAVAGSLFAHYTQYIDPGFFTIHESIFILAIVAVGGAGTTRGPITGAVLLVLLPEALKWVGLPQQVAAQVRQMLYGVILVAFMMLRPQGLLGEYLVTKELVSAGRPGKTEDQPSRLPEGAVQVGDERT